MRPRVQAARALSAPRKRRYHRLARVHSLVLCGRAARPRRQTQASRSVLSTQLRLLSVSLDQRTPLGLERRSRIPGSDLEPRGLLPTSPPSNRGTVCTLSVLVPTMAIGEARDIGRSAISTLARLLLFSRQDRCFRVSLRRVGSMLLPLLEVMRIARISMHPVCLSHDHGTEFHCNVEDRA